MLSYEPIPAAQSALPILIGAARGDEKRRLVSGQINPMLRVIIRLAFVPAVCVSAIKWLRRFDVDLQRRTALLRDTKKNQACSVPFSTEAGRLLREALHNPTRPISYDLLFFSKLGREGIERAQGTRSLLGHLEHVQQIDSRCTPRARRNNSRLDALIREPRQ